MRNFRLFWIGQMVSMSGTWMQTVAQNWLVLSLTGSGVALGVTVALQFLPMLLFGMWGGLLADRFDKRRILFVTQVVPMVLALVMFVLVATGAVALWMVYVLAFLLGLVFMVDMPTRQSFVVELVGPDELPNAVGLNSAMFNAGRMVGPAVAGVLIATVGTASTFLLNARPTWPCWSPWPPCGPAELFPQARAERAPGAIRAGLRYVWSTPALRSTLLLVAVVGTFGMNFTVVLPILARYTFDGGAPLYGWLTSLMSAGLAARRPHRRPPGRVRPGPCSSAREAAFGVLTLVAAVAPSPLLVGVVLVAVGVAIMLFLATANTTLQLATDPAMRGRVMALYGLVFLGQHAAGRAVPRLGLGSVGRTVGTGPERRRQPGRGRGGRHPRPRSQVAEPTWAHAWLGLGLGCPRGLARVVRRVRRLSSDRPLVEPGTRRRHRLPPGPARLLGVVVVLGCCAFVGRALARQWSLARAALAGADPLWLAAGFVAAGTGLVVVALVWRATLRLLGADTSRRTAVTIYFRGELGKYVPGGPWGVLGRSEMITGTGVRRAVGYGSVLLALLSAYVACALIALALVPFGLDRARPSPLVWLVPAALCGVALLHPAPWRLGLRLLGRPGDIDVPPPWRQNARLVVRSLPAWILDRRGDMVRGPVPPRRHRLRPGAVRHQRGLAGRDPRPARPQRRRGAGGHLRRRGRSPAVRDRGRGGGHRSPAVRPDRRRGRGGELGRHRRPPWRSFVTMTIEGED